MPTRSSLALFVLAAGLLGATACGDSGSVADDDVVVGDSGQPDSGQPDGRDPDAPDLDGGDPDGPDLDGGDPDAPDLDGGDPDGGDPDGPEPDAPDVDAGVPDAPIPDAPIPDAPIPDAPIPDAPQIDGGVPDAPPDAPPAEPDTIFTLQPPSLTNVAATRFDFVSTIPGSTFTCRLDSGAAQSCTSPYQLTVADGTHMLTVHATSPQGVDDASPAVHVWTIDTTPPVTTFDLAPPTFDNSELARFQFSSEPLATFVCALDGAAFAPCTSPHQTAALVEGAHVFEARATDRAGNLGPPQRHDWTVDRGDPDTVIDSAPPLVTSDTTATFTFSSPDAGPGATFTCRHNTSAATPCTSPWTVSGLGNGPQMVRIRVRDVAGNEDPTEATHRWDVDIRPPTITIFHVGGLIKESTPSFSFNVNDDHLTSIECRITGSGATPFAPCVSPYTAAPIPDGAAAFEIRARDQVGHETIATRAITVDATPPIVTITSAPPPVVDSTPVTVTFTVNEPTTNQCRHTGVFVPCTDSYTTPMLADGNRVVVVLATDPAGNATYVFVRFAVDTQNPTVTITSGPSGVTAATTPTFGFEVSGGGTPSTFQCQIDQLAAVPCASPYTTPTLSHGGHVLTVTATDQAGHSASTTRAFTVDTTPLTVTITSSPMGVVANAHPPMTFTSTGNIVNRVCFHDNVLGNACNTPTSWAPSYNVPDGTHTYSVRVTDDTGATATATSPPFTVDTTAPIVTFTSVPPEIGSATTVTFAFTVAGDPVATDCRFFAQSNTNVAFAPCTSPQTYAITATGAMQHVFEVRVRDAVGNMRTVRRTYGYWP